MCNGIMKKSFRYLKEMIGLLLCVVSVITYNNAEGAPFIVEEEALSFGMIAVGNSADISAVIVKENGKISSTHKAYILKAGNPAKFVMVGYLPHRTLFITTLISSPVTTNGVIGANQFTLKEVTAPFSVSTDSQGGAIFYVGGKLETSGDINKTYHDTDYGTHYTIAVNY